MRLFYRSVVFAFAVFFCGLIFSCSETQFPDFTIENCEFSTTQVTVTFSAEPDQYMFVKAFTIKEDSASIDGTFCFDDKKAMFIPDEGIKDDYLYELVISTDAEDVHGNSLERKYEATYTTRTEFERPTVVSITPADETNVESQVEEILITFSEGVDINSFRSAFSISPSVEYIITAQQDDTVIKIRPSELLDKNKRYDIKVSTKLTDKHRNNLLNDFESTFTNFSDEKTPDYSISWNDGTNDILLSTQTKNENILNSAELVITFDEKIGIDYIMSYVEITPSISMDITPDRNTKNTASITFGDDIEWETEYTLKVLKGLKDLCGNEIKQDKTYTLVFNNEKNRPVTIEKVLLDLKNGGTTYDEISNYCTKTFDVAAFPITGTTVPTNVYAIFNISKEAAGLSDLSVMNAFSVEYTNTCFNSIITKTVKILNESQIAGDSKLKAVYDGISVESGKLCVVQIGIEIVNSSSANVGQLVISFDEDIKDTLGNALESSCEYHINKQ